MLPRIFLVLMQVGAALYFDQYVKNFIQFLPKDPSFTFFVSGIIFALIVWLVGHVGGVVLKDVKSPSPATLSYALVGGLIGAAIVTFFPSIQGLIKDVTTLNIKLIYFPLVGAIIGYFVQK